MFRRDKPAFRSSNSDDGSRTHVRKSLDKTFFVDSLLFQIPLREREQTHSPSG